MGVEHPRWGAIMGVVTTMDVEAGEELFTYYGYSDGLAFPEDFPWYWEMEKKSRNTKI